MSIPSPRPRGTSKRPKPRQTAGTRKPKKVPCFTWDVKEKVNTATLGVPGVEVVSEATGKPFLGPFYSDELELLRRTLRQMPKRALHVVLAQSDSLWIYRKS